MAAGGIDIRMIGDKKLSRKFAGLERKTQGKIVRPALRNSAKRIKPEIVKRVSGLPVGVVTGRYLAAWQKAKIRRGKGKRGLIRIGIASPTREELGISPQDPFYFPNAIEYGHEGAPPHPHMRPAVDENRGREHRLIGREIGRGIEREFKRA